MKNVLFLLFLIPFILQSQDPPGTLYEAINITVKAGQEEAFEAAVKAHNATYHPQGAHFADLFYNINGPNGGTYSWIMGPTNWAGMDNRPANDGHDDDWANNVGQYVESISTPQYWNGSQELSHINPDNIGDKSVVWVYDIRQGKGAQFAELLGKVKKVYMEKLPEDSYFFGWNAFANADGQDAVLVFPMNNWAELDEDNNFGALFVDVHGAGSWHSFLSHVEECVNQRVDWIRERID